MLKSPAEWAVIAILLVMLDVGAGVGGLQDAIADVTDGRATQVVKNAHLEARRRQVPGDRVLGYVRVSMGEAGTVTITGHSQAFARRKRVVVAKIRLTYGRGGGFGRVGLFATNAGARYVQRRLQNGKRTQMSVKAVFRDSSGAKKTLRTRVITKAT